MTDTALYYALSTVAQCAAALAALIWFLGIWRLDRVREERTQALHMLRNVTPLRPMSGAHNNIGLPGETEKFWAVAPSAHHHRTGFSHLNRTT